MNKRLFLLVTIFLSIGGGTFMLLKPNPSKQMDRALASFKERKYAETEALVATHACPSLYKGYIEQARGRFDVAHRYLKNASKEAKKTGQPHLMGEVALAQATNAFLTGKDADFLTHLEGAQTLSPDYAGLEFLIGLEHYLKHAYGDTLRLWNAALPAEVNSWQKTALEGLFNNSWKKLHIAHCLIEQGDVLQAREIIEKESRAVGTDPETLQLANLFLGLSYLKEGQKVSLEQRGSYYKLARFYFDRAGTSPRFARERERTITHIEKAALDLLIGAQSSEERKWGFDLVRALQEWHAEHSVERLTGHLASKILFQKSESAVALCEAIRTEFHGTPFHLLLTEKMLTALSQAVKAGEADDLFSLWALVEQIAPSSKMAAKKIASLTSEEILEAIKKDNFSLTRTQAYIAFWEKLGRSAAERIVLAQNLVVYSKLFWHAEQQEKKGQQLMELALSISQRNHIVEKEISTFLTTLYTQAERSNMIGRLSLVYDAMETFQIGTQELVSRSTLANHLADASYLYDAHNYSAARTHAAWVLRLDHENQEALRLAGLALFQMGEYGQAFAHLKRLDLPDEETHQALMLSQAFASQEQTRHICQTDPSETYEEEE